MSAKIRDPDWHGKESPKPPRSAPPTVVVRPAAGDISPALLAAVLRKHYYWTKAQTDGLLRTLAKEAKA